MPHLIEPGAGQRECIAVAGAVLGGTLLDVEFADNLDQRIMSIGQRAQRVGVAGEGDQADQIVLAVANELLDDLFRRFQARQSLSTLRRARLCSILLEISTSNWMATPSRVSSPTCRSICGPAQAMINNAIATAGRKRTRPSQRSLRDGGTFRHTANPDTVIAAERRCRSRDQSQRQQPQNPGIGKRHGLGSRTVMVISGNSSFWSLVFTERSFNLTVPGSRPCQTTTRW